MMNPNNKKHKEGKRDQSWIRRLERMSAANEAARVKYLKSLTLERAIEEFEQLCRETQGLYGGASENRSHPVGLIKYVREHNA